MIEVNANARFARRHKLRASGDGLLQVDGPSGFRLAVRVVDGAPVGYHRPGSPVTGTLRSGEQITVAALTKFSTLGELSIVDVVPSDEPPASFEPDHGLSEAA